MPNSFSNLDPAIQMFFIMGFAVVVVMLVAWACGLFNSSYGDMVYSTKRYHVTKTYMSGVTHEYEVERIVIKRIYANGKIKFIEKEVKI